MARSVDDVEQLLADLLLVYAVPKGSGEEIRAVCALYENVLAVEERPLMLEALRRWLRLDQQGMSAAESGRLRWTASAVAQTLQLVDLGSDIARLADDVEARLAAPEGEYEAERMRKIASSLGAGR